MGRPKITLKKILEDDTGLEARELQTVMLDRVRWRKNFVMSPIFSFYCKQVSNLKTSIYSQSQVKFLY